MNEIYVKGLEGAFLVVLNLIDELDCKSGECKQLRDKNKTVQHLNPRA